MQTKIKQFKVDAKWIDDRDRYNFDEVQNEVLAQFDKWRNAEHPHILSVNFGMKDEDTVREPYSSHYWFIDVLYYH